MPSHDGWIDRIEVEDATGRLAKLYDRIRGPDGTVDNIMMAHSLRPHTMEGHMALYKSVLHHARNQLPRTLLEAIGVYVSHLNGCAYCVDHHLAGLARLLDDDTRLATVRSALTSDRPEDAYGGPELAALRYARELTLRPAEMERRSIDALRDAGLDDGGILEVNQVVAYFAYANRTVLGLGISTRGDTLGLSPNATEATDDWSHR